MKKFFGEFKKFISKGNILDLAIAVVLGNAFNKIINTLVNSIIMPLIGLATGGVSMADWKWVISPADPANNIPENAISYGAFLQAIVDFLIIAMCLFLAVKIVNVSRERFRKTAELLKKKIKELSAKDKKKLKKQGVDVEKLEAENKDGSVEEVLKETKPNEPLPLPEPTKEEALLMEIRDLLKRSIGEKDEAVVKEQVAEVLEQVAEKEPAKETAEPAAQEPQKTEEKSQSKKTKTTTKNKK